MKNMNKNDKKFYDFNNKLGDLLNSFRGSGLTFLGVIVVGDEKGGVPFKIICGDQPCKGMAQSMGGLLIESSGSARSEMINCSRACNDNHLSNE